MKEIKPIFEEHFEVPAYFVGENLQMTVSALFSLLTEISNRHAATMNAGWHQLRERGYFWVITRMHMEINRLPKWTEQVALHTWIRTSQAASSPREYELIDAKGNILVAASSIWAILDLEANRPQRMSLFDSDFNMQDRCASKQKAQKISAISIPERIPEPKNVYPSDIDMNHHVNNARYIQWAFDSVKMGFEETHRLSGLSVNFLSQAKLGDQYAVYTEQISDNSYQTTLFSARDRQEYCRIVSEWQPLQS